MKVKVSMVCRGCHRKRAAHQTHLYKLQSGGLFLLITGRSSTETSEGHHKPQIAVKTLRQADMEIAALCVVVVASLRVVPDRSQFFEHDSVSVSCENSSNAEWEIKRNTSYSKFSACFGKGNASYCSIEALYLLDSGVYWCQSASGECSNAVNITVTDVAVILEIPVLPVKEGEDVTLRCRHIGTFSNFTALFYKDGAFIGRSSTTEMTIRNICKSDEGLYRCNISGSGESAEHQLTITALNTEPPRGSSAFAQIALPVVGACISLGSLILMLLYRRRKGEATARDVSYTDVITITQDVHPRTQRGENTHVHWMWSKQRSTQESNQEAPELE
ncbi:uncharacterized protein LOC143010628 isoform X2 [Genypterus blacodes]|uniref:uncharacterized protein LOC143010628 isoform X2 n=1 Tax=Genypterus blacodes TaxID=154954 RepID=UPI003F76292B